MRLTPVSTASKMNKNISLTLCTLFFLSIWEPVFGLDIQPVYAKCNQYTLSCRIDGDSLLITGNCTFIYDNNFQENNYLLLSEAIHIQSLNISDYQRIGDTLTFSHHPSQITFCYSISLADYRTADGAIVLRREGNWYPHRNGELLTAEVHLNADGYYMIGGSESQPSFELHILLLPKEKYERRAEMNAVRPFFFYHLIQDTTAHPEAFYREFMESYSFYSTFFGDTLSHLPMEIVEIGDPQFVMCQSLRNSIIFGPWFWQVYNMMPDFSWVPHEVAHQWWGNSLFFEHRDYALSESLTEYIKLQFLKSRHRGYDEQMEYYQTVSDNATEHLPIADIRNVEGQDASIAIYHTAPLRLEKTQGVDAPSLLKKLYQNRKGTLVSRELFLQECGNLREWLYGE